MELLVNGNAETGDLTGWTTGSDGMVAVSWSGVGWNGVADPSVLGEFAFTGREGPATQSMVQTVDVSEHASSIDSGAQFCRFGVLLMSIRAGGYTDTSFASVEWLSAVGSVIGAVTFTDTHAQELELDWETIDDVRVLPSGTRQIRVTLSTSRVIGSSSDGWADNASLMLMCDADLNGDGFVNGDDYDFFASLFESGGSGADLNDDGFVNGDDYDRFAAAFELGC